MPSFGFLQAFIAGMFIAASAGMLGSFALLKRMALVGDALSHVALPGIALGLIFNFNPFFGAFVFLMSGALLIWIAEHKTKLPVDALVGIFFSVALAFGAMLTPKEELLEALFGNVTKIEPFDFWLAIILSTIVITVLYSFSKKFILTFISPDLSLSVGLKPHRLELTFLLIFALSVLIGMKFAGVLLMGSLIIIPAATARNIAGSMYSYVLLSVILSVIGALLAVTASYFYGFQPGPAFVIIAGAFFLASIFFKK
ncbi:MAG: metal ABC transporter permease [Candidatus Colwellbacteria bacterium]|nr:metal ABC transporter permease [Candidatus Colwellbacteria bacterium]MBI3274287.1 metal ABC transporter permease [Candidatus Colwellbacteria bacterium]